MAMVIVERDGDGDVCEVFGVFPDLEHAMGWLRGMIPEWMAQYKEETGHDANIVFYHEGAADGVTCTSWLCEEITDVG